MKKTISVFYTASARKDLQKMDSNSARKIVTTLQTYTAEIEPLKKAKPLGGVFQGLYRYRIGDYRVIFECDKTGQLIFLTILRIKHRKDVYR